MRRALLDRIGLGEVLLGQLVGGLVLLLALLIALAGCTTFAGHPLATMDLDCEGDAVITVTGQTSLTAGYGGAGQNSGTINAKCNAFKWHSRPPTPAPPK